MGRDEQKRQMRKRILDATDRLFYGNGIRATGVDAIATEIGISKRTLYNHFPSKDALVEAYLERRFRPNQPKDAPPATQILGNFDRIARMVRTDGFRGCPFVNAVAEIGETDRTARRLANNFKEAQRLFLRLMLERAGAPDPDGLATQLSVLVDGAITCALVRGDPAYVEAAREAAVTLLTAAGIAVPQPIPGEAAGP